MMYKRLTALFIAATSIATSAALSSCDRKKPDFYDINVVPYDDSREITSDTPSDGETSKSALPSEPYITALANNEYYLEVSLVMDMTIITNIVAMKDGVIESFSSVGRSYSHTLSKNGETFFVDDENKVYFKADTAADGGLQIGVDYSEAVYLGSGRETLTTGREHRYDEYACKTSDGEDCGVKIFTNDEGGLVAIVDYYGDESIERDVSAFSAEIPEGWLFIPDNYTLVDEDTYFENYYGN